MLLNRIRHTCCWTETLNIPRRLCNLCTLCSVVLSLAETSPGCFANTSENSRRQRLGLNTLYDCRCSMFECRPCSKLTWPKFRDWRPPTQIVIIAKQFFKWEEVIAWFQPWSRILAIVNLKEIRSWAQSWHDGWQYYTPSDTKRGWAGVNFRPRYNKYLNTDGGYVED
jgi:hypothetical protein